MAVKARGRGAAAAIGLFLLLAGLVGGGVLYVLATQRPERAVDGFARAPVGCTTTLEFTETGTFYVFEESGAAEAVEVECTQVATPGVELDASFPGDLVPEAVAADDTLSYDIGGVEGRSVRRVEIVEAGQYQVAVVGDDLTKVAAIGRDPDDGVADLRRTALIVAVVGTLVGLALLVLSGRRSRRAATTAPPDGPGWPTGLTVSTDTPEPGAPSASTSATWPPKAPQLDQIPIAPAQPVATPSTPPAAPKSTAPTVPLPAEPAASPPSWQPPSGDAADELPPPTTPPVPGAHPPLPPPPASRPED